MRNIIKEGLPDNVNQSILGVLFIIVVFIVVFGVCLSFDFYGNKKYNISHVQTEDR